MARADIGWSGTQRLGFCLVLGSEAPGRGLFLGAWYTILNQKAWGFTKHRAFFPWDLL